MTTVFEFDETMNNKDIINDIFAFDGTDTLEINKVLFNNINNLYKCYNNYIKVYGFYPFYLILLEFVDNKANDDELKMIKKILSLINSQIHI